MSKVKRGIRLAVLTAFISGVANFIAKIGVSVADPIVHTTFRVGLVALLLNFLMLKNDKFKDLPKLSKKTKIKLLTIGIVGGSLPFILFFKGLALTSALSAALIHKTLYIWVAFLAIFFLKERITFKQMFGYLFILWANMILFGAVKLNFGRGEMMVFAATIFWALENIIAKSALSKTNYLVVAWARLTIGSIIIASVALFSGKGSMLISLSLPQIITIFAGATTLLFYVLTWYSALSYAPATLVSALLVPATLVTNILTGIFITRTISFPQIVSGLLVIIGVGIIVYFSHKVKHKLQVSSVPTKAFDAG